MHIKNPFQKTLWRGFTLVELLVVISIIALLAGLLLPVIVGSIKKAETSKAQGEVTAIAEAVAHYLTEYSKYPGQSSGTTDHQYSSDYKNLIETLRGSNFTWGSSYSNPRGIPFLSVDGKSIATNSTGSGSASAASGELADPWGNRYQVIADWTLDNTLGNGQSGNSVKADNEAVYGRGVAVWSYGPKGVITPDAKETTHVRSWR